MRPRGVDAFGTTVAGQQQGESIEQRFATKRPPDQRLRRPVSDSDTTAVDNPDAIAAEDNSLGRE